MVEILSPGDVPRMREAGRVAAATLAAVGARLAPGMSTADIDAFVRIDTAERGARPSQLGYEGFPAAVCVSRNHVVCHGIPSATERLCDGDIVNVDVTSCKNGFHGDTSRTFLVGEVNVAGRRLVEAAWRCLLAGIEQVRPGARLGDIGAAIESEAARYGYSVVRDYGGHGIGRLMHMDPHVSHVGQRGRGQRLREGMAFTIEPMINEGGAGTRVLTDGWTVVTRDGKRSAQFEHTVVVTATGCEVLTAG